MPKISVKIRVGHSNFWRDFRFRLKFWSLYPKHPFFPKIWYFCIGNGVYNPRLDNLANYWPQRTTSYNWIVWIQFIRIGKNQQNLNSNFHIFEWIGMATSGKNQHQSGKKFHHNNANFAFRSDWCFSFQLPHLTFIFIPTPFKRSNEIGSSKLRGPGWSLSNHFAERLRGIMLVHLSLQQIERKRPWHTFSQDCQNIGFTMQFDNLNVIIILKALCDKWDLPCDQIFQSQNMLVCR